MTLPAGIANKLLVILEAGVSLPSSSMQHSLVEKMIEDGVIQRMQSGRTKSLLFVRNAANLRIYINNHFGIANLEEYAQKLSGETLSRNEAVLISGDSKLSSVRTFKGFLINTFLPVKAVLNGRLYLINPAAGSFHFIYDYEAFIPDAGITIVGIENPENFRFIEKQQYLFKNINPLFVSRYPQNLDLVKWLKLIPNSYLHFGDLDFSGINIYLNEFKKHLGDKASFFIPDEVEMLLEKFGNRTLYNRQLSLAPGSDGLAGELQQLLKLFHKHKKVLEQEVFIK